MTLRKIKNISEPDGMNEQQKLAWQFAKEMARQVIHDPSGKTSRRKSKSYTVYTRESIEGYLEAPMSNEKNLRDASVFMYQTDSRYRNLIQYYANLPCWLYTINAVNYNPDKIKIDAFKKQYLKMCNIAESVGVAKTMREVVTVALREGAFYGAIWGGLDGSAFVLQKLNPDYCAIQSVVDGGTFQFTYDVSKIQSQDLETYYPPQFGQMYRDYQSTGNQYQIVPQEISFCVKADPSIPDCSIPVFSSLLPSLYAIKNIEALSETASELSNYKLIAGKIPVDDEGIPTIEYNTVMQYYNHLIGNVGERVGVAFTPFELKDYSFEQSGNTSQVNTVARANENFFSAAGTSALLHGATNSTSGTTKLSINVDESFSFGLMLQCEKVVNNLLKTISGTQKFKLNFLPVSVFNRSDMIEKYKSALNYGMAKTQYLVALGVSQTDIANQLYIEKDVLDIDNLLIPLKTASTQSSNVSLGRPEESDTELGDEGEKTRDNDANSNR